MAVLLRVIFSNDDHIVHVKNIIIVKLCLVVLLV